MEENKKNNSWKLNIGSNDENNLDEALKESMKTYNQENDGPSPSEPEEPKFKAFEGNATTLGGDSDKPKVYNPTEDAGDDPELVDAIKMSYKMVFFEA